MPDHKTRRGALLAQLEWARLEPGVYRVEGRDVQQRHGGSWFVEGADEDGYCWFGTFTDALEYIAEAT